LNFDEVALCGLYCGLCASKRRIPRQASGLRETLRKEGYDRGYFDVPGLDKIFSAFWEGLNLLADQPCPGCRAGGGLPNCNIRTCVRERHVVACPFCPEFPCDKLSMLSRYPLHMADAKRMREVGLEKWIQEQEARERTGFAYADIRYPEE